MRAIMELAARNPRRHDKGLRCLLTFTGQGSMRWGREYNEKGAVAKRGAVTSERRGVSLAMACCTAGLALFRSRRDESIGAPPGFDGGRSSCFGQGGESGGRGLRPQA